MFLEERWKSKTRIISIINDTDGWSTKWCRLLKNQVIKQGDKCRLYFNHEDMPKGGDIAFFLGCTKIAPPKILSKNLLNIVLHASDLPKGRGFSPLKWQIIEGLNHITVSLIEAIDKADAGKIFSKKTIKYKGHELLDEMQDSLGKICNDMCLSFLRKKKLPIGKKQIGLSTYYKKRTENDQRIDPKKSLLDEFNKLRVADNNRFPAFFTVRGIDYEIKIKKK